MAVNPKNPSTLVFWNDLENDERLKTCSLAAKGLWTVHMLSIAARSPEPGVVLIGDHPCRIDGDLPKLLARVAGESPDTIADLLAELVASGTASVDRDGRVYNRRMVRAHGISKARSEAGKAGAEAANAKRQKSGKGVGKEGSKQSGKEGGKIDAPKPTLSDGNETEIHDKSTSADRQNSGNGHGETAGKSSPSSLLHASESKKESPSQAAAFDAARERREPAPQAAAAEQGPRVVMASRALVDEAFRRWTVLANDLRIPDVGYLNSTRRTLLAQRLGEVGGLDGWDVVLEKIRAARFLLKPDGFPKHWVGLGKLLDPETFSRLLENRYAEHHERTGDNDRKLSGTELIAAFAKAGAR